MADKIKKLLAKLSKTELKKVESLINSLVAGNFEGLDVKQLRGHSNGYRARKGRIRIIFSLS